MCHAGAQAKMTFRLSVSQVHEVIGLVASKYVLWDIVPESREKVVVAEARKTHESSNNYQVGGIPHWDTQAEKD